jgi:hypothetical protein
MLIGEGGTNKNLIEINRIIDKVINKFFPKNPIYHIFPTLYQGEVEEDSDFFHDNQTPLLEGQVTSSDDLKTIAHLSLFHKDRIAYNAKSLDIMLQCAGLMSWDETAFSMGIYRIGHCGDSRYSITADEYFDLPVVSKKVIQVNAELEMDRTYFDGLDVGMDILQIK